MTSMTYSGDNYPGHPHHEDPMPKRTYTNHKPVTMELVETIRPGHKYVDPVHSYPIAPGASITLRVLTAIRRYWRKN